MLSMTRRAAAAAADAADAIQSTTVASEADTSAPSASEKATAGSPEASDSNAELSDTDGFVSDVCQYYNSEELSDLVLLVRCADSHTADARQFNAHKFVLAKSSEFFRTILYSANWASRTVDKDLGGGGDPRTLCELVEDEACFRCFDHFLRFLYAGRVVISRATSIGLLRLADKYQVWALRQLAETFMAQNSLPPNVCNALLWYTWAKHLQLERLASTCFNTVCWNARRAVALEEFLDTDCDFVRDLLGTDRLVIDDEYAVLQLLLRWLSVEDRFDRHADELLRMIRFPMMSPKQLFELETSSLNQNPASSDLLASLINKAYRFRSLCPWQHELKRPEFCDIFYRPRSYLCLSVDSIKVGNTMRFGLQVDIRTQTGPVPNPTRDAEWKMVYQKACESWTFKLLSQDSSFPTGTNVTAELVVLCENDTGDIVNYFSADYFQFTRSSQVCQCQFDIRKGHGVREAKNLHVLLKVMTPS